MDRVRYCENRRSKCTKCRFKYRAEHQEINECPQCGHIRGKCRRNAYGYSQYCWHHGGRQQLANTLIKERNVMGRYGASLPAKYLNAYYEALEEKDNLNQDEEIALLNSRMIELMSRADTGESGALWNEVGKTWKALNAASLVNTRQSKERAAELHVKLDQLIAGGLLDTAVWDEINKLIELKRKVRDTEVKRITKAENVITKNKAEALMGAMVQIILDNVHEDQTLRQILQGIDSLKRLQA